MTETVVDLPGVIAKSDDPDYLREPILGQSPENFDRSASFSVIKFVCWRIGVCILLIVMHFHAHPL